MARRLIPTKFAEAFSPAACLLREQESIELAERCELSKTDKFCRDGGKEARKRARYWRKLAEKGGNDAYRYRVERGLPLGRDAERRSELLDS